jgi:uncharacterized protein (UPF0335 family)
MSDAKIEELGDNSGKQLLGFIERIESLEAEKRTASDEIKAEKAQAKAAGFDLKALNQILKERKADMVKTMEHRAIVETYRRALGQYGDTELGKWALNSISEQAKMRLEGAQSQYRGSRLVDPTDTQH